MRELVERLEDTIPARRRLKPLLSAVQERIMAPLTGAERQTFLDFLTRFGLGCVQVARYGIGCRTATGDALRFVTAVIGRK